MPIPGDRAGSGPILLLGWLGFLGFAIGLVSLVSYSLGAPELVRPAHPGLAASWGAHQFYFMQGGATAFGLVLGIRIVNGFGTSPELRVNAGRAVLIFAIIAFIPLIRLCTVAARLGWNGRGASLASRLVSREGYEAGRHIDKVLIAGIYFLKTAGLALLAGLGLMVVACVVALAFESANTKMDAA
jgi:hypothetical protein